MPHKHELEIGTVSKTAIIFDCRTCFHSTKRSKAWVYDRVTGKPLPKRKFKR